MDKGMLDGVAAFLAVARHLSFSRAAAALGVTASALSKAVRQLEQRHGVMLFQRTTRSVALTESGAALYQRLRTAADEIEAAFAMLDGHQDRPAGTLRLTLSRQALELVVEPLVPEFRRRYPEVTLDLSVSAGLDSLAEGGYDAGIWLGESVEKDMVAVRLTGEIAWSVVGSPDYFARAGRPRTPEELVRHEGILYRFMPAGAPHRWEFRRGGRSFSVEMKSHLVVNERASLIAFARAGLGLAYVADPEVAGDLAAGRLASTLRSFIARDSGLYLYFPARMQRQPKLRAFIDLARQGPPSAGKPGKGRGKAGGGT